MSAAERQKRYREKRRAYAHNPDMSPRPRLCNEVQKKFFVDSGLWSALKQKCDLLGISLKDGYTKALIDLLGQHERSVSEFQSIDLPVSYIGEKQLSNGKRKNIEIDRKISSHLVAASRMNDLPMWLVFNVAIAKFIGVSVTDIRTIFQNK